MKKNISQPSAHRAFSTEPEPPAHRPPESDPLLPEESTPTQPPDTYIISSIQESLAQILNIAQRTNSSSVSLTIIKHAKLLENTGNNPQKTSTPAYEIRLKLKNNSVKEPAYYQYNFSLFLLLRNANLIDSCQPFNDKTIKSIFFSLNQLMELYFYSKKIRYIQDSKDILSDYGLTLEPVAIPFRQGITQLNEREGEITIDPDIQKILESAPDNCLIPHYVRLKSTLDSGISNWIRHYVAELEQLICHVNSEKPPHFPHLGPTPRSNFQKFPIIVDINNFDKVTAIFNTIESMNEKLGIKSTDRNAQIFLFEIARTGRFDTLIKDYNRKFKEICTQISPRKPIPKFQADTGWLPQLYSFINQNLQINETFWDSPLLFPTPTDVLHHSTLHQADDLKKWVSDAIRQLGSTINAALTDPLCHKIKQILDEKINKNSRKFSCYDHLNIVYAINILTLINHQVAANKPTAHNPSSIIPYLNRIGAVNLVFVIHQDKLRSETLNRLLELALIAANPENVVYNTIWFLQQATFINYSTQTTTKKNHTNTLTDSLKTPPPDTHSKIIAEFLHNKIMPSEILGYLLYNINQTLDLSLLPPITDFDDQARSARMASTLLQGMETNPMELPELVALGVPRDAQLNAYWIHEKKMWNSLEIKLDLPRLILTYLMNTQRVITIREI